MQLGSRFHNLAEAILVTIVSHGKSLCGANFQVFKAPDTFLGMSLGEPALEHS